jgi:hypothetical protein
VRNRVVAHLIADAPNGYPGAGQSATQALFYFLRRRLGLQVVPAGYGLAPMALAAAEGWRSASRAVVMARLNGVEVRPTPAGQGVVTRLEVVVVKISPDGGRLALRRIIESAPTVIGPGRLPEPYSDPVLVSIARSLESIGPELFSTLRSP